MNSTNSTTKTQVDDKQKPPSQTERFFIPGRLKLQHIKINADKLRQTACQNKQVPDTVAMADFRIVDKPINPHAIQYAAQHQPKQPAGRKRLYQRPHRHHNQPAHQHINHHRQQPLLAFAPNCQLFNNAQQSHPPSHAEKRPAPTALQGNQRKRRIAACNQKINHTMIDLLQNRLGLRLRNTVV